MPSFLLFWFVDFCAMYYNKNMKDDDDLIKNRLFDLADRAFNKNLALNSNFLNLHEQKIFAIHANSLAFANPILFGGNELCERKCVFFNDNEFWNLTCLKISAQNEKYSDKFAHKDFLGAILNLGIDYSMIGDIFVVDNAGFVFCLSKIAQFIADNLLTVKRTNVIVDYVDRNELKLYKKYKTIHLFVESTRLDLIVSRLYKMSRSEGQEIISSGDVFVDDDVCKKGSIELDAGDIVSVRRKGKFRIDKIEQHFEKKRVVVKIYI